MHDLVLDGGCVAVVDVAWHACLAEQGEQVLAHVRVQAVDVMQLYLVEEGLLAGDRVADDGRARGADLQFVVVQPGPLDAGGLATGLDFAVLFGLEKVLPGHVELVGEGAYIQQAFAFEALLQRLGQAQVHLPAIDHRRGAAHG
ncbi:hypothetical protein D3C85_1075760 [compost metagenome]